MRFDTDTAFQHDATAWLQSLTDEIVVDLQAVFRRSPGYYPTTLVELWRGEVERRGLIDVELSRLTINATRLPVCHPGDYEWRFTAETATTLLEQAASGLPRGAVVAHLGTPTTFVLGRERHRALRHMLLDRNQSVVQALGAAADVYLIDFTSDDSPRLDAAAAILDPPWYPADTRAFLVAANRVCALGARIVLCQPTLATRPGIAQERTILLDELSRLGFLHRETAARVRYQMPHFEAASLKMAAPGLLVPSDWRVGDALTLEKISDAISRSQHIIPAESWHEVTFGPVRIKLRRTEAPNLGPLVPGDVLDTVSRRDPIRKRIGLWTSGNRVFTLKDPAAIGRLIEFCHTDVIQSRFTLDRTLSHARMIGADRRVARQLFDLLLIELQEHTLRKEA
jgi:hypothetical protein